MSGRGFDDTVSRIQCAVAGALCAIGLALAVVPEPGPEIPDALFEAAPALPDAPAPARQRSKAGAAPMLTAAPVPPVAAAVLSRG